MILAAILALALADPTSSPAPVVAATPAPASIILDACRAEYGGDLLLKRIIGLRIKFTNEGNKTASVVRVAVNFNGNTLSVRDVGSFAPNVTINHDFRDLTGEATRFGLTHEDQPKCRVQFIKFDDGTIWAEAPEQAVDSTPSPTPSPSPKPSPN
jgi:hypothetical protein